MKNSVVGDMPPIILPAPIFDRCWTVFEAPKMRGTSRFISEKKISLQILSDILWAAQGVNRVQGTFGRPGWTAGSASNSQEFCVYVVREEGTYVYEPDGHKMMSIAVSDSRRFRHESY